MGSGTKRGWGIFVNPGVCDLNYLSPFTLIHFASNFHSLEKYKINVCSDDYCPIAFAQDLQYWEISESFLENCCLKKFSEVKDHLDWTLNGAAFVEDEDKFPPGAYGEIKKKVWDLFEKPHTSVGARIIAVFSVICIFVSTVILTLNTLPMFLDSPDKILGDYWIFAIIEMVYMSWFTIEFFVR